MSVKSQLESVLFVAIKPLTSKELANLIEVKIDDVKAALEELVNDYKNADRGFTLISNNGQYQLTTSAENSDLVKNFLKDTTIDTDATKVACPVCNTVLYKSTF